MTFMGRDRELKWLAFSLYPLSFFLYSPFNIKNYRMTCIYLSIAWKCTKIYFAPCDQESRGAFFTFQRTRTHRGLKLIHKVSRKLTFFYLWILKWESGEFKFLSDSLRCLFNVYLIKDEWIILINLLENWAFLIAISL